MRLNRYFSALLISLGLVVLTSCNSNNNNTDSVNIQAQPLNSAYYTNLSNGPRYQVISIENTSTNNQADINNITFTGDAATNIVNRNISGLDPIYGNYSQCALTTNSSLNQVHTLAPRQTCLLVLLGTTGAVNAPAKTGTLTLQADVNGTSFSKTFNLNNTTYLYVGGNFTTLESANAGSNFLLAKCSNSNCSNFFGDSSTLGANGNIFTLTTDLSGNLYVGGGFNNLGTASADSDYLLAKCSHSTCTNFFGNFSTLGADNGISAITSDTNANLYVGGSFKNLGPASAGSNYLLAKCSHSTCTNFFDDNASGANHSITHLITDNSDNVYATGNFNSLGSANASSHFLLAQCKNSSCVNFFGNNIDGADNTIASMAIAPSGDLLVGGNFKNLGSTSATSNFLLAQCNSSNCINFFGNTSEGANSAIETLSIDTSGNIYVGGSFSVLGTGSTLGVLLAKCNGALCTNFFGNTTDSANDDINTMSIDGNDTLYVTGSFTSLGEGRTASGSLLATCSGSSCFNFFGNTIDGPNGTINSMAISNQLTVNEYPAQNLYKAH